MAENRAEFWSFVSGKGGVGKSVLALNIARVLFEQGRRVLLLDADLGLANLHVLANAEPAGRLERVLVGADDLTDAITPLGFGPDLLAAETGQSLCMLSGSEAALELAHTLDSVGTRYDYVLVDTPRGVSDASLQFCRACDRTLLVTTDEPTAMMNCYAWYKTAVLSGDDFPIWLVANATSDKTLSRRFRALCRRFVGQAPHWAGMIPRDASVPGAVARQRLLWEFDPDSAAWEATKKIALNIQSFEQEGVATLGAARGQGRKGALPRG